MPDCEWLVGGGLSVGLGIVFLFFYLRERDKIRLAAALPVSACGSLAEGMVRVAGRAVGSTTLACPVSGASCLILSYKVEQFHPNRRKKRWQVVRQHYEAVPFHVEDSTGQVLVDPAEAEFHSEGKLEFSTQKRWRPSRNQRHLLQKLGVPAREMEARLRSLYAQIRGEFMNIASPTQEKGGKTEAAQRAIAESQSSILRFSHEILRPGDPVCVVGPAMEQSAAEGARPSIDIRKIHPSDPFFIGVGSPDEVQATIRRKARNQMLWGIGFLFVGAWMLASCYR